MKKLVSLLMVLVMALMAMNVTTFAVDKDCLLYTSPSPRDCS